ncbi:uncharacterized protein LOC134251312 [Saccostrea cucullata]|uniref:uncharacterized protein LOC134251312 n=1 Tax=Saccostrea cuccullata TaxID=36930 RepID=UPI002ED46046
MGAIEAGTGYSNGICDIKIRTRIILISDGRPTDFHIFSDEEDSPLNETLQVGGKGPSPACGETSREATSNLLHACRTKSRCGIFEIFMFKRRKDHSSTWS